MYDIDLQNGKNVHIPTESLHMICYLMEKVFFKVIFNHIYHLFQDIQSKMCMTLTFGIDQVQT